MADLTSSFLDEVDRRLPGRLTGLFLHGSLCWGEFHSGSDVDFVGLWDELPTGADMAALREAHEATRARVPVPTFDGFHCTAGDLRADPARVAGRPVYFAGSFDPVGALDINPVTWQELAERPVVVRGRLPEVHTDHAALVAFTRDNLDTYWRGVLRELTDAGAEAMGRQDDAIAWVALGAPRLHHLLTQGTLTSKSGAGRYVLERLDPRWARIGREALRLREAPSAPGLYGDPGDRGRDAAGLLAWVIEDGVTSAGRGPNS